MKIYQIDAFSDQLFGGNPAAICPMDSWITDEKMQLIALENNLSETAFFVREDDSFHIRWFTPEMEIDLCGHATLASAHVIFNHLGYRKELINFKYGGGFLSVKKQDDLLCMDFPAVNSKKIDITNQMTIILGHEPLEAYEATRDLMLIFGHQEDVEDLTPDFVKMYDIDHLGIIVTARGKKVDFVSRFFAPRAGINEDPVTGSAHCMLVPFWAKRLGKNNLEAMQLSKRVGRLFCEFKGQRVDIAGRAITYLVGEINI